MCNFIVTDEEINKAEQDIFLGQGSFSDEQKAFLKCLDSCSLQSYAGSGKTSTLVGKLHILAQKRVWETGKGICVISHTNIAIDEIKSRVANHYPEIMEYPNFVGTIQEFVNKFLFIPYLASVNMQIRFQDESRYLDYDNDGDTSLKTRISNKLSQLRHGGDDAVARFWNEFHRLCFYQDKVVDSKKLTEYNSLKTIAFPLAQSNTHIKTLIDKQHQKGNFLFIESFIYALEYLKQHPVFSKIISKRFNFVLLDESQDCSEIQLKLLDDLFGKNTQVCFQQIGDINQSISEDAWSAPEPTLFLGQSIRCGSNLITFVSGFCLNTFGENTIRGSTNTSEKILITYSNGCNEDLLEKFSEILISKQIPHDNQKGYFAIAYEHDQLIESFPDSYSRESTVSNKKNKTLKFSNDIDYINLLTPDLVRKNGTHHVSNILYRLLYKHFKNEGTWTELHEKLFNEDSDFKKMVLDISNEILTNGGVLNFPELQEKLNIILGEDLIKFNMKKITSTEIKERTNSYKSSQGVNVRIGTIHSVKGQTHNATLFISSTKSPYGKYDIEHGMQNNQNKLTKKYKKLIYVASSRPQDLFAFAIQKTIFDAMQDKTCFEGFEIVNI
ncbi:MAG: UvrD-helicase domain-containing protein [Candidatus Paceibacterota bacterium]